MTYFMMLIGRLDLDRLRAALAVFARVPVEQVDVSAKDIMERDWEAAVLCTYEPVAGDISWWLDIYLAASEPPEDELAEQLAAALGVPVVHSAQDYPPSAHWLVEPNGSRTRARIYDGDREDGMELLVDAVERPVALLPHVKVEPQPEVIREHRMPTPVADDFRAWLVAAWPAPADGVRSAASRLAAWEAMTVRMASGWPPDGWYPVEYYQDDLALRDELAGDAGQLPPEVAARFTAALASIDEAFRAGTREADPESREPGWWWRRVPDPQPWS